MRYISFYTATMPRSSLKITEASMRGTGFPFGLRRDVKLPDRSPRNGAIVKLASVARGRVGEKPRVVDAVAWNTSICEVEKHLGRIGSY